jgi:hypothetical protein
VFAQVRMMGVHDVRAAFLQMGRENPRRGSQREIVPLKSGAWNANHVLLLGGIPRRPGRRSRRDDLPGGTARNAPLTATPPTNGVNVLVIIQIFIAVWSSFIRKAGFRSAQASI